MKYMNEKALLRPYDQIEHNFFIHKTETLTTYAIFSSTVNRTCLAMKFLVFLCNRFLKCINFNGEAMTIIMKILGTLDRMRNLILFYSIYIFSSMQVLIEIVS